MPLRILKKDEDTNREKGLKKSKMLSGGQAKLDKNKNNKLDAQDFKILRAEKAKGRSMGLQDEKMKPGKPMKAALGAIALGLGAKKMKEKGKTMPMGIGAAGYLAKKKKEMLGKKRGGPILKKDPTKPVNPFQPKPIKPLGDGKMAFDDTPRFELRSLTDLLSEFEADNRRSPNSIDELKRYFYNKYGPDFLSKIDQAVANESKDVAMETKGQGNDVYAMLRARLPQEIPDEVVKLLTYNKQAFADFASIKNQEDVTSFNEKYNVSMNIDVSTV